MSSKTKQFTHRDKLSGYMPVVLNVIPPGQPGQKALDIPAGAGHLGDALKQKGYDIVYADINKDRNDYVFTDLNGKLPFENDSFDVVTCLEGIEHVLDPFHLVGELARIVKPGGQLIISTPNIMNLRSRIQFLFTGTFFQFRPILIRDNVNPGELKDRGHISPVSYHRLRYLAEYYNLTIENVHTDKYKSKTLFILYPLVWLIGRWWGRWMYLGKKDSRATDARQQAYAHCFSNPIVLGRTMIVVMKKQNTDL